MTVWPAKREMVVSQAHPDSLDPLETRASSEYLVFVVIRVILDLRVLVVLPAWTAFLDDPETVD